jgi:hypothetical protein
MKKIVLPALLVAALALAGGSLFAQEEGTENGFHLSLEFNGSIVSADSDGVIESMTDAGFNEDETKLGASYESELWGVSAALKFSTPALRMLLVEELGESFLGLDELYAWVKPFGEHFKFTAGIFENSDGIAAYTDDIDDFDMGIFIGGGYGAAFTEPEEATRPVLSNGFLSEAAFGPVTVQFLLGPNYGPNGASGIVNGYFYQMSGGTWPTLDLGFRFFHVGGRIIADLGVATIALTAKDTQWPVEVINNFFFIATQTNPNYPGDKAHFLTFGAHADITAVENLGISLGWTGYMCANDADDIDNVLWNGIDLRATYTGIDGLSLSTHNNISFAKGAEKEWMGELVGDDSSFFAIYNAIGMTKDLSDKFAVNAEIGNIFSKTDKGGVGDVEFGQFLVSAKLISHITEAVEFDAGLSLDVAYGGEDDPVTTFSVPIAIKVSF